MANATLLPVLKVSMILLSAGWVCVWLLKPTELWSKSWHIAEDSANTTIFGYYGLDFAVYSFPIIAVAIIGFIYLHFVAKESRNRQMGISITTLSNPLIIHSPLGIITGAELLAVALFILFLAWTMYAHISNDFKKMIPSKSLKLNIWQFKFMKIGVRFGLLAEACLALLLLPVLRGMALFRLLGLQFEASVRYHVWLGTAMILFATLHGSSIFFIWCVRHRLQDMIWQWQKTGRVYLAGEIALVIALVIWITSLPQIRRKRFEIFYYTHHLYTVFLVFFLFHVGDRHFYMVFSGVFLFSLDKLLRIIQSRPETCLVSARILPCKAIELSLSKHPRLKYTPTSVIFVKIPTISKFQWHPFSITSSSSVDNDTISVIIKCEGWWTTSLYNTIHSALDSDADQVKCLPVAVEGPYGPVSADFLRYDSLLLVAGGVGVTPFLSILQEIASTRNNRNKVLPTKIQLIYVMKKSQDISLLNPIAPLLLNQSAEQGHIKLKIFVTQEERSGTTVRELLNELSQVQTVNFDKKCSNYAMSGLESLLWMATIAGCSSIIFLVSLSCVNHAFLDLENNASKQKSPSWVTDILLICSFVIATTCSTLATAIMRWRKLNKEIPPAISQKQGKGAELSSMEAIGALEEHEIHFIGRPNLQDVLSKFPVETGRSEIGLLVCGPQSMKESVALFCQQNSQGLKMDAKRRKPYFSYHSLNFAL
ncbi:hypothetical protein HHK36_029567 [Tetracentron sinense]|uniref:FAD-binding FR-type domain-containing protein n=1 Tax=Tetracentron sinense TaxID=13715 RepID=A0A834YB57_TETSI|nr:hypothetical protein HHK36_029567 [Tetracentron sinense]